MIWQKLPLELAQHVELPTACSFGWWLVAGDDLF
jgi:hypothetical protein